MTSANSLRTELRDAQRARSYFASRAKAEHKAYWRERLTAQNERIRALTEELIHQEVRINHE